MPNMIAKMTPHPINQNNHFYRADIDGLRAVAVLSVVACHAGLGVPGGYIGVDVFFVISGFLITSLILKDLERETFSFVAFWERRARRILPALAVVTTVILAAGWFALGPTSYVALGRSVTALSLFASNIYFWHDTNYFSHTAAEKPLLHTWSLAVEEQFYLIVPVVLYLLSKLHRRRNTLHFLVAAAVISAAFSVWFQPRHPDATFYLLPTRAWELLAGAILAFAPINTGKPPWIRQVASAVGLAAIVVPSAVYGPSTPFPGLAAFPPVLGTAAIIWAGLVPFRMPVINRCLAWRPIVLIGLFSYSLYLWHWPVLAYAQIFTVEPIGLAGRLCLVTLGFILGILSWRYVELPFRHRRVLPSRRQIFTGSMAAYAGLLIVGLLLVRNDGYELRRPPEIARFAITGELDPRYYINNQATDVPTGLTSFGSTGSAKQVLVWGDSHAMAILPALEAAAIKQRGAVFAATHAATPPVTDVVPTSVYSLRDGAVLFNAAVLKFAQSGSVRSVVLAGLWGSYFKDPTFEKALLRTVDSLIASGVRVYFVLDVPKFSVNIPDALVQYTMWGRDRSALALSPGDYEKANFFHPSLLPKLRSRGVHIIDPLPSLTGRSSGEAERFLPFDQGGSFYRDDAHLSTYGALRLTDVFLPVFD